jgi:hypothetical protein
VFEVLDFFHRAFCKVFRGHKDVTTVTEWFDYTYLADHHGTPRKVVFQRCLNCGAVVEGMTVRDIMRMRINPWDDARR